MKYIYLIPVFMLSVFCAMAGPVEDYAAKIAPLIDPAKLATLSVRGANTRVQKIGYWLEMGRRNKATPAKVIDLAMQSVGMTNAELARKRQRRKCLTVFRKRRAQLLQKGTKRTKIDAVRWRRIVAE